MEKSSINEALFDCWNGAQTGIITISHPSVDKIIASIDKLDANRFTALCLKNQNGHELIVGGGEGKYVVYVESDGNFWNLISKDKKDNHSPSLLNVGGQEGDFPERQLATKQEAVEAATHFSRNGSMSEKVLWEEQN